MKTMSESLSHSLTPGSYLPRGMNNFEHSCIYLLTVSYSTKTSHFQSQEDINKTAYEQHLLQESPLLFDSTAFFKVSQ